MQQFKSFSTLFLLIAINFFSFTSSGQTWTPVSFAGAAQVGVRSFCTYNGDLIVAGDFDHGGNLKDIAKWNQATMSWDSLGGGQQSYPDCILCMAVYNGELYTGGNFDSYGNGAWQRGIRRWNGTSWSEVGPMGIGMATPAPHTVRALAVYNGELYAGGYFMTINGMPIKNIGKWNGTSWSAVDSGFSTAPSVGVHSLVVHNGKLYAGTDEGQIGEWDGTSWTYLGAGMNNPVYALASLNGDLYAAGCFTDAGGVAAKHVAKWDGLTWTPLGTGIDSGAVFSLGVYDGHLYAGGFFKLADSYPAHNIARWNGTAWSPLTSGTDGAVYAIGSNNLDLYLGGDFNIAGGIATQDLAKLVQCTSAPAQLGPIAGNAAACAGNTLNFSVAGPPQEVFTYTWTLPQGWTGTSSGSIIKVTPDMNPGNITVTAVNNCGSSVQTVAVNPFQLTPVVISQAGSVLVPSVSLVSCQWYLNGNAIPGATNQTYIPPQDGNYQVTGIDVNGCSVQSNILHFLLDIESTTLPGNLSLYPNPTSGVFTIEGTLNSKSSNVSFEIIDLMGRSIYRGELAVNDNHFRKQVQLQNAAPGMYVLKLKSGTINESYSFAVK